MQQPEITVLMPVYNAGKYLAEAIDSILAQTFTKFEFLIINDGSSDNSVSIINSYTDPRIRLVHNERNLGISATLNKGIELSRSELIARMDADDISYPDRLEKQFNFFKANPEYALVSTWAREVTIDRQPLYTEEFKNEYYPYFLNFECWIYHPTVMYKRSAVMEVGMYSKPHCEDYDLWCKLLRTYKIHNLSEVLLDYRSSDTSLCRVTNVAEYEDGHHVVIKQNISYYFGQEYKLSYNEIECLRYNCTPLLRENSIARNIKFLHKLSEINKAIGTKRNVNLDKVKFRRASRHKLKLINDFFIRNLPFPKRLAYYLYSRVFVLKNSLQS